MGGMRDQGLAALPMVQRPGQTEWTANDLSGRYWLLVDERYVEEPCEDLVPEADFSGFPPKFACAYIEHVHRELAKRFPIGCAKVLSSGCITATPGTVIQSRGCVPLWSPTQGHCLS